MYVSVSRLQVDPARGDELVATFRGRAGLVESHAGFVDLEVWRSDREPGEILMVSRWQDREAFKAYMRSSDHRASHGRIEASLKDAITLAPPSGDPPPVSVVVGGVRLDLLHLAEEICRRYREEFPDEEERYAEAGQAWCIHDNQHLLNWAAGEANGHFAMNPQVAWLARILEARHFPLDRLARNLELAADVVRSAVDGVPASQLAQVLVDAAGYVRERRTFLD